MKIYSWNLNGIRAAKKKGFLTWVNETSPDILCLQETRIQPEQLTDDLTNLNNYHSYFHSGERKGYSGVALYSKKEPLNVEYGMGIKKFDREGRVLTAEYDDFIILSIYFPNGRSRSERLEYKLDFHQAILDYCEKLKSRGKGLIISGDYNIAHHEIDLHSPENNVKKSGFLPIERRWVDKFIKHGYIDTYRQFHPEEIKYSWWSYRTRARSRNAGWRIDYHFISEDLVKQVISADILTDVMGSDHCPIFLELEV